MSKMSQALVDCGALQFGDFTLASGAKSSYYIDIKRASTDPKVLKLIAQLMAENLAESGLKVDRIAGVVLGSVPLAAALSLETGIPYIMIRKEKKDHGTGKLIEGILNEGDNVLVVEDVITSAGSSITAIGTLREAGAKVENVYSVIDREAGGADNLKEIGIQLTPLVRASELLCDAHDPRVSNAVPLMGIDNVIPSYQVLKTMLRCMPDLDITPDNFMVISPDEGALGRNMYYATMLGVNLGMFYKRRDYSKIVEGKNPIVAHEYLGNPVDGKTVFVADDIIASGESMLDLARSLKEKNASRILAYATYGLFTHGLEKFDKAYEEGVLDAVFGTNLTYRKPELLEREWFHEVDVSKYAAYFIASINHDVSISTVIDPHEKIHALLAKRHDEKVSG